MYFVWPIPNRPGVQTGKRKWSLYYNYHNYHTMHTFFVLSNRLYPTGCTQQAVLAYFVFDLITALHYMMKTPVLIVGWFTLLFVVAQALLRDSCIFHAPWMPDCAVCITFGALRFHGFNMARHVFGKLPFYHLCTTNYCDDMCGV